MIIDLFRYNRFFLFIILFMRVLWSFITRVENTILVLCDPTCAITILSIMILVPIVLGVV